MPGTTVLRGAGLGLRRPLLQELIEAPAGAFDFLECAPENWIGVGGHWHEQFQELAARHPIACHGLSLSLGGPAPLDMRLLADIHAFLQRHGIAHYSEHLSWCSDQAQLYDLLPLPMTDEAVRHVAARIRQAQDALGMRIAIENVSTYATPFQAMDEATFVNAVLQEADCGLLLDINNVYVNSINHRFDARAYIDAMPGARIVGHHVAGHYDEADDLKIDTHGAPVKDDVWTLLAHSYARHGVKPTLLERDFNLPPLPRLLDEVARIRSVQREAAHA